MSYQPAAIDWDHMLAAGGTARHRDRAPGAEAILAQPPRINVDRCHLHEMVAIHEDAYDRPVTGY
jgi:hypothetical protein